MTQDEGEDFVSRGKDGKRQVRRRRADGWTSRKRRIFLDHFRSTSNFSASARAAGMSEGSAFKLRARDPVFATDCDAALAESRFRLESKVIVFAETRGKPLPERADGEPAEAPIEDFDPDLALRMLAHHRQAAAGGRRRGGPRPKSASKEELVEAVVKLLGIMKRRRAAAR